MAARCHVPDALCDVAEGTRIDQTEAFNALGAVRRWQTSDEALMAACKEGLPAPLVGRADSLPEHLLLRIFSFLQGGSRRHHFSVCGVSQTWRRLGLQLFFANPWGSGSLICHPSQLFCTSPRPPRGSRTGLLKCYVVRDASTRRFSLWLGKDPGGSSGRSRFLLSTRLEARGQALVFADRQAAGEPVARMRCNTFGTTYRLERLRCGGSGQCAVPAGEAAGDLCPVAEGRCASTSSATGEACADSLCAFDAGAVGKAPWESTEDVGSSQVEEDEVPLRKLPAPPTPSRGGWAAALGRALVWGRAPGPSALPAAASPTSHPLPSAPPRVEALASLHYRARVRGLMQPRRVQVTAHRVRPEGPAREGQVGAGGNGAWGVGSDGPGGEMLEGGGPSTGADSAFSEDKLAKQQEAAASSHARRGVAGHSSPAVQPTSESGAAFQARVPEGSEQPSGAGRLVRGLLRLAAGMLGERRRGGKRAAQQPPPQATPPARLRNKTPHWNATLRCWCLNFRGRVKLASVKNFQLVEEEDAGERVVLQFGKVDRDVYILDFNPTVLSAVQSFGIALSTFTGRVVF